ncbi:hypothetical protein [Clostridium sp.]|uniref:hypothetical protein n=1 Tax=Clostridium sp. TaxID=1506 RepID=UPI0026052713|nr:hypothetical protein [Clostridium sp.]
MIKCKVNDKFNTSFGIILSVDVLEDFKVNDIIEDSNGNKYKVLGFVNPSGFQGGDNIQSIRVKEIN